MVLSRRRFLGVSAAAAAAVAKPAIIRAAEPLTISTVFGNSIHWVQLAAVDKGFYQEAGFEPKLVALQSSAQSIQLLLNDEYQLATSQPEPFIAAVEKGATNIAAISAPTNYCDWVLVGAPGLTKFADLKGKVIGVSALRNSEVWLTQKLAEAHGLKRGDLQFQPAGTSPAKLAALTKNSVDAAVLFQPSGEAAIQQGLPELARYAGLRSYPTILYAVRKDWAANGGAGKRASAVIQRTHAWLWDPANKADALQILAKYSKRALSVLEPIYNEYFVTGGYYSKTGQVELDGLKAALADMAEDGAVFKAAPAPSKFILDKSLGGLAS